MNNLLNKAAEITRSFLDTVSMLGCIDYTSTEIDYGRVSGLTAVASLIMFIAVFF